jgi:hypothetical protein
VGLDTRVLTSTRLRSPNPVFSPAPLIRTTLAAVSTPALLGRGRADHCRGCALNYLSYVAVYL